MEVKLWSTCILPVSSEIRDKTNIEIHHRHLLDDIRIALLWWEWKGRDYISIQSLFILIPSHQGGYFNWHKITFLGKYVPQCKTILIVCRHRKCWVSVKKWGLLLSNGLSTLGLTSGLHRYGHWFFSAFPSNLSLHLLFFSEFFCTLLSGPLICNLFLNGS